MMGLLQPGLLVLLLIPPFVSGASPPLAPFVTPFFTMPASIIGHADIGIYKFTQTYHITYPNQTWTYGYGFEGHPETASYPGPTLIAVQGSPSTETFTSHIDDGIHSHILGDPANEGSKGTGYTMAFNAITGLPEPTHVTAAMHLHGGDNPARTDGHPLSYFGLTNADNGPQFYTNTFPQENTQWPSNYFYHDHAFGITRLNIVAGMVGAFIIAKLNIDAVLTGGQNQPGPNIRDIPVVVTDRTFTLDSNGHLQIDYNPGTGEYYGDTLLVNGRVYPFLPTEPRLYRIRFVNGCNARFVNPRFEVQADATIGQPAMTLDFYMYSAEQGLFPNIIGPYKEYLFSPAERTDMLVDFSCLKCGAKVTVTNSAVAPYPSGGQPVPPYSMQFILNAGVCAASPAVTPQQQAAAVPLRNYDNTLSVPEPSSQTTTANAKNVAALVPPVCDSSFFQGRRRALNNALATDPIIGMFPKFSYTNGLFQVTTKGGVTAAITSSDPMFQEQFHTLSEGEGILIDNVSFWDSYKNASLATTVKNGGTMVWWLINFTIDVHPMHTHLFAFQVLDRFEISITAPGCTQANLLVKPSNAKTCPIVPGTTSKPDAFDSYWKDTVKVYPGTQGVKAGVTRLAIRVMPQVAAVNQKGSFPASMFSPPFYVWHCHILEHEEQDMMAQMNVV